jgi:salicylate hydroxylase
LEQSSLNREIGATISLQPNASKIVEQQWGLGKLLQAKGSMVDEGFEVYNLEGELQIKVPLSTMGKYGAERVLFHRVDLHDVLRQRATSPDFPGRPATIRVSSRVVSCKCDEGEVKLEDGELLSADLIVGADGIKSVIRPAILGKDVAVLPTGHSAYRMIIPMEQLLKEEEFVKFVDPRRSVTTMVFGHEQRLIMGPARSSTIYSIVAMVPDEKMSETSNQSSWITPGDPDKMLKTFEMFPEWAKKPLRLAKDPGLWQLRDLEPFPTWYKGRAIIIGDAAHAMLPTQGQGASQAIEDAEALGAFLTDFQGANVSLCEIEEINKTVFECRYDRASTIQGYSRQTARPATDKKFFKVNMNPTQFMEYNCNYSGALDWHKRQEKIKAVKAQSVDLSLETLRVSI